MQPSTIMPIGPAEAMRLLENNSNNSLAWRSDSEFPKARVAV